MKLQKLDHLLLNLVVVFEAGLTVHFKCPLRYEWPPSNLPSKCDCGNHFTVEHTLSCAKGGFPSIRHNKIHDLTANLLTEVCSEVCIQPNLQPTMSDQLSRATANSQDGAGLDVSENGVWGGRFEKTFFDPRVFNSHAPFNKNQMPSPCYRKHEKEKKRVYEQRMHEVEHSSFTPLFSATGGMGREATCFYKHLASMLAQKWDCPLKLVLPGTNFSEIFGLTQKNLFPLQASHMKENQ